MRTELSVSPRLPLYFGPSDSALFGCYDPPAGAPARDRAVVLCQPVGQEYIRAHRSFVQLATRLARAGFPVLRFDYCGCGDSAGDVEDASLARWIEDVGRAIDEVRRRSGRSRVSLVGLRLGAALAAHAACVRDDVASLVLWAPVFDGAAFLRELRQLQAELLRFAYVRPAPGTERDAAAEVLGFRLPAHLREELERLDLLAHGTCRAPQVLIIDHDTAGIAPLEQRLRASGVRVETRAVAGPRIWLSESFRALVPHQTLETIVQWLSEESV